MQRFSLSRLWPRSLKGQVLLAIALALMLAQGLGAVLLYRAQTERREAVLIHTAAMRLFGATRREMPTGRLSPMAPPFDQLRSLRAERSLISPLRPGERRLAGAEAELRDMLGEQEIAINDIVVTKRAVADDAFARQAIALREAMRHETRRARPKLVLISGIQREAGGDWIVVRVPFPSFERALQGSLIGQTLFIYTLLVGAVALALRRITRPLAALTERFERFAETRDADGQIEPEGPDDVRRLIVAHNAMEGRIAALLDEKDVMLGAIGHDLKTPLAALRVRIESVEDEVERSRMASTIEDIVRTLDDILTLARVGKSSELREASELSALVGSVVEEYEDMGEPVTLADSPRMVLPLRSTLVRRALRNLIGNALRYGMAARVSLARDAGAAIIRIDDDGPGIPDDEIGRMMEPFKRGDPSRNSETGGTGLGLTLARAIALQHGGSLALANRRGSDGQVEGLTATLRLPRG